MPRHDFKVVISGGGISGLAVALKMHQEGFERIQICESSLQRDPAGFGINLRPHACQVLHELGLLERLIPISWCPTDQRYYTFDGRLVSQSPVGLSAPETAFPQVSVHRGVLCAVLESAVRERLGDEALIYGLEGISYEQDETGIRLHCKNKRDSCQITTVHGNLLIAAEGLNSPLRQQMLGAEVSGPIRRSGNSLLRAVITDNVLLGGHSVVIAGRSAAKLVCYPISRPFTASEMSSENTDADAITNSILNQTGKTNATASSPKQWMNIVMVLPEIPSDLERGRRVSAEECISRMTKASGEGFDLPFLDVGQMIRKCIQFKVWPLADRDPINRCVEGRVVLIGDAAHPMYPVGSNGASSAILGAKALVDTLVQHRTDESQPLVEVEDALEEYQNSFLAGVSLLQLACRQSPCEKILDEVHDHIPRGAAIPSHFTNRLASSLGVVKAAAIQLNQATSDSEDEGAVQTNKLITGSRALHGLLKSLSPLERVLATAKGTLQQCLSSYVNDAIVVCPLYTVLREGGDAVCFDRLVDLRTSVDGKRIARCWSIVMPKNENMRQMIQSKGAGIGQLYAMNAAPPSFQLVSTGRIQRRRVRRDSCGEGQDELDKVLTRQYRLDSPELLCFIYEEIELGPLIRAEQEYYRDTTG